MIQLQPEKALRVAGMILAGSIALPLPIRAEDPPVTVMETVTVTGRSDSDERSSDIDYYYPSRLKGKPMAGVDDIHTHPNEPFSVRLTVSAKF